MNRDNFYSQLNVVWEALHAYHRDREGNPDYDQQWQDICQSMYWIQEDLEAAYQNVSNH